MQPCPMKLKNSKSSADSGALPERCFFRTASPLCLDCRNAEKAALEPRCGRRLWKYCSRFSLRIFLAKAFLGNFLSAISGSDVLIDGYSINSCKNKEFRFEKGEEEEREKKKNKKNKK